MICKKCGQEIADSTGFCPYCGQNQNADVNSNNNAFKEATRNVSGKVTEVYIKSDKLFTNIGNKLCKIAKIVFWVGAVVFIIAGLVIMFGSFKYLKILNHGGREYFFKTFFKTFFGGILGAALGVFASWLSSLGLYAFGELVRRVQAIEERMR